MISHRKKTHERKVTPPKKLSTEVASVLILGTALFTLCALITFHSEDPSLFSQNSGAALNACGRAGAFFASLFLNGFGIGAFLIPAALFFSAATLHQRAGVVRLMGTLGGMTIAVLALTVFLTLHWTSWPYRGASILPGGALGVWVSDFLREPLNPVGASIVAIGVFALALVLSTPVSIASAVSVALMFVATMVWRGSKLIVTYLLYFVGLASMRVASAASEGLQQGMRSLAESARAKAQAMAAAREQNKLLREQALLENVSAKAGEEPLEMNEDGSIEVAAREIEEDHEVEQSPEEEDLIDLPSEWAALREKTGGPEILPRELTENVVKKATEKLARAAKKQGQWKLPTVEFLKKVPKVESEIDKARILQNSQILTQKFKDFGIEGEVTAVRPGPVITLYEFKPGPGIKVSRIASLADDLSMALSAESVRILAPLPGKSVVGIEIPSDKREMVFLREFLQKDDFYDEKRTIPVVMGKDTAGLPSMLDLARMPHLLCAGQTGSGKSVFMNTLICSLLYRFTPEELRLILVDPKYIEFRAYQDIPHLLLPVVDDAKEASTALKWAVREMERRYRILAMMGARNLESYNQKVESMGAEVVRDLLMSEENQVPKAGSGSDWMEAFELGSDGQHQIGKLPFVVVIIDELADLMMIAKKDVEISIARIAQKARAAGIHLVIATQRPSTDVITGLIKANLPTRVSFQLASFVDSKTILDRAGAERLLGQGDMLCVPPGSSQLLRLHGAYVDDEEINKITQFLRSQGEPSYREEILVDEDEEAESMDEEDQDPLFDAGIELVKRAGHASASFLQRHLKIGYNRAARMIEVMETRGIVGPADGARPREVLMK